MNERIAARNVVEVDEQINAGAGNGIGELDRIPDVVRCLRDFSGDPGEFGSWKKSVERILQMYEPIRGSHKYFGILSVIRNKIIGHADIVLESYNTPLNWAAISRCLNTHYGDKRDLGTLEYQMSSLIQGNMSIQEFYQKVYTNLSLILNKISCMDAGMESRSLLITTYRNKALDTFIRGLNGDLPRLLGMREPSDLPEALQLCLKLENQTFRTNVAQYNSRKAHHAPPPPPRRNSQQQSFYPHLIHWNQPTQGHRHQTNYYPHQQWPRQRNYYPQFPNQQRQQNFYPQPQAFNQQMQQAPPRPFAPKPLPKPQPMDVDQSIQTQRVNYLNRPAPNQFQGKRPPNPSHQVSKPNKFQRNFHIDSSAYPDATYEQAIELEDNNYGQTLQEYTETQEETQEEFDQQQPEGNLINDLSDIHFLE